jgi:SAM-dependent methyltransferase
MHQTKLDQATLDETKLGQQRHWNAVADGWAAWGEWTDRNFAPLTRWLEEAAGWRPGARVLDVAGGAGYPSLAAAARVRPGGSVTVTDISPEMVAVTSARARAAGLDHLRCLEMDAEALDFEDASFDAVTNAYGLMFCPDPHRALVEAARVLRPGGRAVFVTWDEPEKSPFFTVIRGIAAEHLALPPPDPEAPGPFRLSAPAVLDAMLRAAGFRDVRVESRPMTFECGSAAEYVRMFGDLAWKSRLAVLSEDGAARFNQAVAEAVRPYAGGGGLRLVATSLIASGRT